MCLDLNGVYLPIHYWYSRTRLIIWIKKGPTEQINKPPYPVSQYLPFFPGAQEEQSTSQLNKLVVGDWCRMGFNRQQDSCCLERSRESTTYLPWWGLEEEEADLPEVKEMDKATSDNVNTNWMFSSLTLHQLSKLNKLYINCLKPASTIGYDTCPFKAYFVLEVNKYPRVGASDSPKI